MSASTEATRILIAGCLSLWDVEAQVRIVGTDVIILHATDGRVTVRALELGWQIEAPESAGEPPATWAHASVGPMLRSLRVLLAPDRPHARLIVARAPGAET